LHRDVKPGNFMLLSKADDAPLKAIDFGMCVRACVCGACCALPLRA
jgi:Ser/Thr protein kinase RdoA (MazF antagonist)